MLRSLWVFLGILMGVNCYASEFKLFDHQSKQYRAWELATNKLAIARSAEHVGIPSHILLAICKAETNHVNVATKLDGETESFGICQVKFETALLMQRVFKIKGSVTPAKLNTVKLNSFYAALYLLYQYRRYGNWIDAIEAYNKGSRVSGYRARYVKRVLALMEGSN